jgi:hypothetical protein
MPFCDEIVPAFFGTTQLLGEATNPHQSRQVSRPLVSTDAPATLVWRTRHSRLRCSPQRRRTVPNRAKSQSW